MGDGFSGRAGNLTAQGNAVGPRGCRPVCRSSGLGGAERVVSFIGAGARTGLAVSRANKTASDFNIL
jgi:hypothetical protein